jgi:uncharacterized protein YbjT (DUF2867 family)
VIGLLGATGYTGRLTAAELARRHMPCRLGARNPERLATLPRGEGAETFVVDTAETQRLDAFLDGLTAVISTVGPFTTLGMPVVDAAVRAGVPYVDSTGEPGFMSAVYERHGSAAVPVVPACGFDYIPGDLGAAVAAAALEGAIDEVGVHYDVTNMMPSRGTARSALGVLTGPSQETGRRQVAWPGGDQWALSWAGGERVTVPRHVEAREVVVTMAMPLPAVLAAQFGSPLASLTAPALERMVDLLPEGPPESVRKLTRFRVLAEATGPAGRSFVLCEGRDPYGLTARFLVEAALAVSRGGRSGAMAPAEAFDPESFLAAVSGDDFRWTPGFPVPADP